MQSPAIEGVALLFVRVALAGVFWRSGQSKVEVGTWLHVSDATYYLFENDYAAVPLPAHLAAQMAVACEHLFPLLLVAGALTRVSALALLGMTMVIQIFVFPEAWWSVHILWVALALMLIVRGGGLISLDRLGSRMMPR
ncbi:DoxX family protein [Novosphingobium album (ex Hu et al. 2023)]|uniref:DoxX family protein n=1 Tax=Novosphingobium album (ex Hu et al. 2023) TaxID=2930093 RepID=A0ABT0B2G5_9SPHN|nr:DoxX family protein [Novosphingobium album (ex Hu et al. 2023)]MCJ2179143.1 DoxX family protein [Novosphingobium album (ex Hu et al. 2023)]